MKNIFKSILVLSAAAFVAVSCNTDNIGTVYESEGNATGLSFTQSIVNDTEISAAQTTFPVTVARSNAAAALTVNIESTLPEDIKVPSSVTFNAGEYKTDLVLDISAMEVGTSYKGSVTFADENAYDDNTAISSVSITFAKAFSWVSIGKHKYTDDIVGPLFGAPAIEYEVEVEQAEGFNVFRLIDPYGEVFPYNDPGDYRLGVKWVIDASDPDAVVFDMTSLGVDWGYGEMAAQMLAPGKMVNKVITFPTDGIAVYDDDGGYYANRNGAFKLDLN